MKPIALLSLAFTCLLSADDHRVPVVVELFTSEGCSSCPSADALLTRLEHSQPVANARIIALEEHVDYWNQLGWVDPFSAPQYRARQNDYALGFGTENIFTPQMVVNGHAEFSGNDGERALREIEKAAQAQTAMVEVRSSANHDPDLVDLAVRVVNQPGKIRTSNVYLAVTENELSMPVLRGENSGRTLRHGPVVRSFGVIGRIDAKGSNEGRINSTLRLPKEWRARICTRWCLSRSAIVFA